MSSGDADVGTGPGNSHWCTEDLSEVEWGGGFKSAQMCTGKLEEVRAKLSGSSREFMFVNTFLSAGGILYRHLCPATQILVRPSCFVAAVPGTPEIRHFRMTNAPFPPGETLAACNLGQAHRLEIHL